MQRQRGAEGASFDQQVYGNPQSRHQQRAHTMHGMTAQLGTRPVHQQRQGEVQVKLSNPKDFWSGIMFLAIGLGFAIVAYIEYPMGKGARMGPGYFPFWVGALLTVLGAVITANSLRTTGEALGKFAWKGAFWVTVGIVLFGLLLRPLGLVGASVALVFLGSIPSGEFKFKEVVLLWVILVVLCASVFIYGLKLPIPLWPSFLTN